METSWMEDSRLHEEKEAIVGCLDRLNRPKAFVLDIEIWSTDKNDRWLTRLCLLVQLCLLLRDCFVSLP